MEDQTCPRGNALRLAHRGPRARGEEALGDGGGRGDGCSVVGALLARPAPPRNARSLDRERCRSVDPGVDLAEARMAPPDVARSEKYLPRIRARAAPRGSGDGGTHRASSRDEGLSDACPRTHLARGRESLFRAFQIWTRSARGAVGSSPARSPIRRGALYLALQDVAYRVGLVRCPHRHRACPSRVTVLWRAFQGVVVKRS